MSGSGVRVVNQQQAVAGEPTARETSPAKTGLLGKLMALVGALVSIVYLANLGFGFPLTEFLPDNLPGGGNVDEVVFSFLLFYCLGKLGIRLPFMRGSQGDTVEGTARPAR
jgi:hypothetical protein